MGSGASKIDNISRSFNETLTENVKQTMINKSSQYGATLGATQKLTVQDINCAGDINIADIQQKVVMKYNFAMMEKMMDTNQLNEMMTNAVQKTLDSKTDVKSEFAASGGGVSQQNIDETYNRNVQRLVNSVDMNYFTSVMTDMDANQDAIFGRFTTKTGDCNINNIKQDIAMELAAQQISEKVTDEFMQIMRENEASSATKQMTTVASTGLLGDMGRGIANITQSLFSGIGGIVQTVTQPAIVLGILLLVIVLAWIVSRAFTSGKVDNVFRPDAKLAPSTTGAPGSGKATQTTQPPTQPAPRVPAADVAKLSDRAAEYLGPALDSAIALSNLEDALPGSKERREQSQLDAIAIRNANMAAYQPASNGPVNIPAPPVQKQGQWQKL